MNIGRTIMKYALLLLAGVILVLGLWTWGALSYVYSSGDRAGYIQKFSLKGWVFKTWEGELAMVSLPGAIPEKFYFTVKSHEVAEKMNKVLGQRVAIKYDEHKGIPSKIFGETPYFASDVTVIETPSIPPTFPVSAPK